MVSNDYAIERKCMLNVIELDNYDLSSLLSIHPVYVSGSKIVMYGHKTLGHAQNGWFLIQLTKEEVDILFSGCRIFTSGYEIIPPIPKDVFIGYGGSRDFNLRELISEIPPHYYIPIKLERKQ